MKRVKHGQDVRFNRMVKRSKSEGKRVRKIHAAYKEEFGDAVSTPLLEEETAETGAFGGFRGEGALEERVFRLSAFSLLNELVQTNSPLVVYTSARAIAEANEDALLHRRMMPDALAHSARDNHFGIDTVPNLRLYDYQEAAIQFMDERERDTAEVGCRGLILADEMGLGKTLETLVYLLRDRQRRQALSGLRFPGPSLLVMPKILIDTWCQEIERRFPPGTFYYTCLVGDRGQVVDRYTLEHEVDLVFTTYTVVRLVFAATRDSRAPNPLVREEEDTLDRDEEDCIRHRYALLYECQWLRAIAEEGHQIANRTTQQFDAMVALPARHKWIITGTPIQNFSEDIYACFEFIGLPHRSIELDRRSTKHLLEKVMIRRLKVDIAALPNAPLLNLVDKRTEFIDFDTPQERLLYIMYADYIKNRVVMGGQCEAGTQRMNNAAASVLLLRQFCIDFRIVRNMVLPSGMLTLGRSHENVLETSFSEKLFREDALTLEHRGGSSAHNPDLEALAFRLNRPTRYNYSSNTTTPNTMEDETRLTVKWSPYRCEQMDLEEDDFARLLYRTIYHMLLSHNGRSSAPLTLEQVQEEIVQASGLPEHARGELLEKIAVAYGHLMGRSLPLVATKPRRILRYIQEEVTDPTDKTTVFCDFVVPLKLMTRYLSNVGIEYCLVTGENAKNGQNEAQLREFHENPAKRVLLMSLKVGNAGLNITCSNHVLFWVAWWNPQILLQAESRLHRPGQTKVVHVRYFILKGTLEAHIMRTQTQKKHISRELLGDGGRQQQQEEDELPSGLTSEQLFDYTVLCKQY